MEQIIEYAIPELPFVSVSRELHAENKRAGKTHFHMTGFARRLVFTVTKRQLGNGLITIGNKGEDANVLRAQRNM